MAATSLDKDKIKVLLLEGVHDTAARAFREAGYTDVERRGGAVDGAELPALVRDVHFLGIRSRTQLTEEVFAAAEKLVAVGAFCIGTNQIDLEAASRRGVAVFNAPFSNTRSVAELVLAEAILLLRGVPEKNAKAHRGEWAKSVGTSREIRGKTLGIVGYGNIGKQLSVLAEGLGMRVVFHDTAATLPLGNAHPAPSLDAVLDQADVVTLHVPDTPQTRGMIGAAEIGRMKPDAVLLNASARVGRRPGRPRRGARSAATSPAPPSTSTRPSRARTTTRSRRRSRGSTGPCSRRTSAARRSRRRRTSAPRWPASSSATATTGARRRR